MGLQARIREVLARLVRESPPADNAYRKMILGEKGAVLRMLGSDGLVKADLMVHRSCPICGKDEPGEEFLQFFGFRWVRCGRCDLAYLADILSEDFHASEAYHSFFDYLDSIDESLDSNSPTNTMDCDTIEYLKSVVGKFGSVCDIGCGHGGFLRHVRQMGYEGLGIDVNSSAIEKSRAKGIPAILAKDVRKEDLGELQAPVVFTMRQLIEHLRDISDIFRWLTESVPAPWFLLVETPNLKSWCVESLAYQHRHFYGWVHLQILSQATMKVLVRDMGFDLIHQETYGKGPGIRGWLETKFTPWIYNPFGDESISKWPSVEGLSSSYTSTSDNSPGAEVRSGSSGIAARRIAGRVVRRIDQVLARLFPGKGEYIRCVFRKI